MVNSSRVAQVGLAFWIIKILSTGLGETGADYLDHKYSPIIVVAVSGLVLLASLLWQLSAKLTRQSATGWRLSWSAFSAR